jgi:hypothetical protein
MDDDLEGFRVRRQGPPIPIMDNHFEFYVRAYGKHEFDMTIQDSEGNVGTTTHTINMSLHDRLIGER